jgi:hypothetical protein
VSSDYDLSGLASNFEVGKGGPRIKSGVGGTVQARDNGDAAFAILQAADPSAADDLATKRYVDSRSPTIVKKTSDQTFTSGTPANVTSLSFAVTSGRYYKFKFDVIFRSDTATIGLELTLTFPGITRFAASVKIPVAADGTAALWNGWITSSGDSVAGSGVQAINTDYYAEVEGVILPSANGTLQLQASTETGAGTITVRQASLGYLWDLGT